LRRMWKVDEAVDMKPAVLSAMVEVAFQEVAGVYGKAKVLHEAQERTPPENESGPETVVACTPPVELVERSAFGVFETVRLDDDAVPMNAVPEMVTAVELANGVVTAVPPAVTSEVPLKKIEFPVVVNDEALVPPFEIGRVPVTCVARFSDPTRFANAMLSDEVATHDGRPVVYELVRKPPVEVASAVSALPVGDPMRSDPSATDESPVPPRLSASVPDQVGAKVKVEPELVMERPRLVSDEVANVSAPVCAEPNEC
jgi:hypothetical protein